MHLAALNIFRSDPVTNVNYFGSMPGFPSIICIQHRIWLTRDRNYNTVLIILMVPSSEKKWSVDLAVWLRPVSVICVGELHLPFWKQLLKSSTYAQYETVSVRGSRQSDSVSVDG